MNKALKFYTGQKFRLPLKSRSEKNRVLEAKKTLSGIYPFAVDIENIFVSKTDSKGIYDVYVSKEKIRRSGNSSKIILVLASLFVSSVMIGFGISLRIKNNESASIAQKELERQKAENLRIKKEKEETLEKLKTDYEKKLSESYEKIYPYMERIYLAIGDNSTVENISIAKESFSIEVTTKDAVRILKNFESNAVFRSIKMNRSTVKNRTETVTYSGEFSKFWKKPDESLGIDERISFYRQEIDIIDSRKNKIRELMLSEYIREIRNVLRKNGCSEQYIQLRGGEKSAEVEFFLLSSSRSMLNFIKNVQDGEENLIDIKQIRIRNSEVRNRVQTSICFDSGIELKDNEGILSEYSEKKIGLSEINKIFYKAPSKKGGSTNAQGRKLKSNAVRQVRPKNSGQPALVKKNIKLKKLSYIGLTKTGGKTLVIAKDDEMGSLFKIPLCESETEGDFCIRTGAGYTAKVRGEYYEVKK